MCAFTGVAGATMVDTSGAKACAHLLQNALAMLPGSSTSPDDMARTGPVLRMCWAWCLQQAACGVLPLEQRSLDLESLEAAAAAAPAGRPARAAGTPFVQHDTLPDSDSDDTVRPVPDVGLMSFISQWCGVVDHLLFGGAPELAPSTSSDKASLLDLFDGRLWHFMFHCVNISKPTGLSPPALASAQGLMHAICHAAGVAAADILRFAMPLPAEGAPGAVGAYRTAGPPPAQRRIQGNPLVDAFLGPQPGAQQPEVEAPAAWEQYVFDDAYHWHTGRPIDPAYIGETHEANLLAEYAGADIHVMAECPHLSKGQRAKLKEVINQETTDNPGLWTSSDRQQREHRMKEHAELANGWLKTKLERQGQKYSTFMRDYAKTLGKIEYQAPGQADANRNRGGSNGRSRSGANTPVVSKVDMMREQNNARKLAEDQQKRSLAWAELHATLAKHAEKNHDIWDEDMCTYMASQLDRFCKDCKIDAASAAAYVSATCFRLQGELKAWQQLCSSRARRLVGPEDGSTPHAMAHAINVWLLVQQLLASGLLKYTAAQGTSQQVLAAADATNMAVKEALQQCKQAMQLVGFEPAAESIAGLQADFDDQQPSSSRPASRGSSRPGSRNNSRPASRSNSRPASAAAGGSSNHVYHVGMAEAEFQLRYCGDKLQRGGQGIKDKRVKSFVPDTWQVDVMDAIDRRESCVICAPTSSGKTFISTFCMDRVMRESEDGIVVFVAPTKALVNQTAAQASKA